MRIVVTTVLLLGLWLPLGAQETPRLPVTYTSIAEIEATLDEQGEAGGGGASVNISDPGEFAPEVMVRRRFTTQANNASVHPERDEIYQVIAGGGTFMTGGTVADPNDRTAGIRGGVERRIRAGDVVVIPAGTLHWFSQIDGSVTYMIIRLYNP